jgi:hypothetical protein
VHVNYNKKTAPQSASSTPLLATTFHVARYCAFELLGLSVNTQQTHKPQTNDAQAPSTAA